MMEKIILDDMIKALKCVASQDANGDCYADHENFMHMKDEHKRIVCGTGEDLRDYISGKEAVGCPYHQKTYGTCCEDGELYWLKDVAELLEELKSYKDLEEHGLLVRLPCKVGDTVYKFWYYDRSPYKIQQHVTRTLSEICELIESKKLGKSVFLTREEAEKKLEEIQNDKT